MDRPPKLTLKEFTANWQSSLGTNFRVGTLVGFFLSGPLLIIMLLGWYVLNLLSVKKQLEFKKGWVNKVVKSWPELSGRYFRIGVVVGYVLHFLVAVALGSASAATRDSNGDVIEISRLEALGFFCAFLIGLWLLDILIRGRHR